MARLIWKGLRIPEDVVKGIERRAQTEQSNWCLVARRILTNAIRRDQAKRVSKGAA